MKRLLCWLNKTKTYIKCLDPIWFYTSSMDFMQGYSKWYIWTHMPMAYFRVVIFTVRDIIRDLRYL